MFHATLSQAAIDKIDDDVRLLTRVRRMAGKVALLHYYNRLYQTLPDRTIVEHGDGLGLSFVELADICALEGAVVQPIPAHGTFEIFVHGPSAVLSGRVDIDYSGSKFVLTRRSAA